MKLNIVEICQKWKNLNKKLLWTKIETIKSSFDQ